ncbi:hypothetical protein GCM10009557_13770 [Virgisporangium ochraceum]|uniref:Uncharacterized protein n=1 Tax=Virgisporangium ochraceum TaxID=65505 RepID=A0A8J3ZX67_9ACTN|nr:hypothetical protein [Virgisporangium ochraceum]GIJ71251.1 hypothetical protein Voc01_061680 [Virgisporangium ochraceum]
MNIYRIDEHHVLHRCPIDEQPHVIDIRRTIVHVTDTGPCLTPVTIGHDTGTTSTVACGRHEPHERQCDNCRTVITTGTITTSYLLGITRPTPATETVATSGLAPDPCPVCGEPLAAVLAARGRHLGCHRSSRRTRPERDAA